MTADVPTVLEPEERAWIEEARSWIKGHYNDEPDSRYETLAGKLGVVAAVLDNGWVEPTEVWKLQSLGIAFGDALAQELMLEWVTVDDSFGRTPALLWPGTSILSFPLTMISKRIEDGEDVDVYGLFEGICAQLSDMAFSGQAQ